VGTYVGVEIEIVIFKVHKMSVNQTFLQFNLKIFMKDNLPLLLQPQLCYVGI